MYTLRIDVGSSSVKVALLEVETGECPCAVTLPATEMPIDAVQSGWAEQDPHLWWRYVGHNGMIFFCRFQPATPNSVWFYFAIRSKNISKNKVVIFPSFSHKLCRLLRYVEIFLPFCFLLAENYSSEIPLLENIFPLQLQYVAPAQSCQTGKQESPPNAIIFTRRIGEPFKFVEC